MPNAHSPSTARTVLAVLSVCLVITAFILIALNAYLRQNETMPQVFSGKNDNKTDQAYKQGYEAARNTFARSNPTINQPSYVVTGLVTEVSGNSFRLTQESLAIDPKADGVSDSRQIVLSAGTKILLVAEKDQDTFRQEMTTFLDKQASQTEPMNPPSPFTESAVSASQIKVGMRLTVESNVDVRLLPTIQAMTVRLSPTK